MPFFLAAVSFLLFFSACSKEEEMLPAIEWQVEYSVSSIGEVTIDEIIYVDENEVEQTIPGQREFLLRINAETGFIGKLEVRGTATNGGVFVRIFATALDGSFETLSNTDNAGNADGTSQNFSLFTTLLLQ